MAQTTDKKTSSSEEYLAAEVLSEERHEYINGEVKLMTGGTPKHNRICRIKNIF